MTEINNVLYTYISVTEKCYTVGNWVYLFCPEYIEIKINPFWWSSSGYKDSNSVLYMLMAWCLNTLRPWQNGRRFADDTFKRILLNVRISIKISLKFVPTDPINNILALVQIMAWRQPGDKPLSEPMMIRLPTHICVTRPQWVNISQDFDV